MPTVHTMAAEETRVRPQAVLTVGPESRWASLCPQLLLHSWEATGEGSGLTVSSLPPHKK